MADYATKAYAAKRASTDKNIQTASSVLLQVGGATAVIVPGYPWTAIAGAGIAAAGLALQVVEGVRHREDRILLGDKAALAGYMKKVAKWPKSKRKREAETLLNKRKELKEKKLTSARKVEISTIDLKLSILYQVEGIGRSKPREPVVPDDPQTVPLVADQQPDDGLPDLPWVYLGGAALIFAGLYYYLEESEK